VPELQENPFVVDERREPFRRMLDEANRQCLATVPLDEQVSAVNMMNVLIAGSGISNADPETAHFASIWELGRFVQGVFGEQEMPDWGDNRTSCGHAECELHHQREVALADAAVRGDGDALIGVCKAVMRAAVADGNPNPERELMKLYVSTLVNVCLAYFRETMGHEPGGSSN
jgi:hypothetical protein